MVGKEKLFFPSKVPEMIRTPYIDIYCFPSGTC